jgi:hypothetical protein
MGEFHSVACDSEFLAYGVPLFGEGVSSFQSHAAISLIRTERK